MDTIELQRKEAQKIRESFLAKKVQAEALISDLQDSHDRLFHEVNPREVASKIKEIEQSL